MNLPFAILAGGRAPACQLQALGRSTARLNFSCRASRWTKEFSQRQPKLLSDPLYGNCLAELAACNLTDAEQEPDQRRAGRNRAERRASGTTADRDKRHTEKQPPTAIQSDRPMAPAELGRRVSSMRAKQAARERPLVHQLPHRADLGRLRLISGESETAGSVSALREPQLQHFRNRKAGELHLRSRHPELSKQWLSGLAERTGRQFRYSGIQASHKHRSNSPKQLLSRTVRSIEGQWSIPLIREVAPADLLARLAISSASVEAGLDRNPTGSRPRSSPDGITSPVISPERQLADGDISGRSSSKSSRPQGWSTWMPDTFSPIRGITVPLAEMTAPILPALLPQKGSNLPELPVASAMIRQGAREEVARNGEEDLSKLSAKIAQILGEEARRHGIDV